MWPRSPVEPVGDVEHRASRRRAARCPARRAARGRSRRARHAASAVGSSVDAPGQRRQRERRVAERARHVDVVAGAARRARRDRLPGRHLADDRHAEVARPARGVAADEVDAVRDRRARRSRARTPRATPGRRPGSAPASSAQRGGAPIAARSDRLTASVLWPSASGSTSARKCRPSTSMSTESDELVARASGRAARHRRRCRARRRRARRRGSSGDQLELVAHGRL